MDKKCLIPEGSELIFYINDNKHSRVEAAEDIEIYPNMITMIDGILICTDGVNPVEQLGNAEYRINCWWQDCMYISSGAAFQSIGDVN